MKFISIRTTNTDWDVQEFETLEEAVNHCNKMWDHLTDKEKEQVNSMYVLESENEDEEAPNHYDGNMPYIIK